jgi:hypothetical protein
MPEPPPDSDRHTHLLGVVSGAAVGLLDFCVFEIRPDFSNLYDFIFLRPSYRQPSFLLSEVLAMSVLGYLTSYVVSTISKLLPESVRHRTHIYRASILLGLLCLATIALRTFEFTVKGRNLVLFGRFR